MKLASKTSLAQYLLMLLWLLLFKFTSDLSLILGNTRSLNVFPFAEYSRGNPIEMILNFFAFVPLGLLLSVNFGRVGVWRKLTFIFVFSFAIEVLQSLLAVGVADITDIIMNTSGGVLGLVIYELSKKYIDKEKVDHFIIATSSVLLVPAILVFGILLSRGFEYQSAPHSEGVRLRGNHRLPPLPN